MEGIWNNIKQKLQELKKTKCGTSKVHGNFACRYLSAGHSLAV